MSGGDRPAEDLTARARIRDAALRLFAERGADGATVRDIARAAGVSAGLVRHHFRSKEALRDACDAYALEQLMSIKGAAVDGHRGDNPAFLASAQPTLLLMQRYLARSMIDGTPAAASLFDGMVALAEQWLTSHHPGISTDPRAYAAVLVAMQAGPLLLHSHLSRALGTDILDVEGHLRLSRAIVDVHTHALLSPDLAAEAHAAYDRIHHPQPHTPAEPSSATEGARQ